MAHGHYLFIDIAEVNIKLKHSTHVYTCRLESYIAVQWESGVMGFLLVREFQQKWHAGVAFTLVMYCIVASGPQAFHSFDH